ncbi:efflux RND transporter permease subunit [candidate division KSB1 bacterium]|nr:efflux RND transporter permease subunit [candidate division KSB1 bacterium]
MFEKIIRFSLENRFIVVLASVLVLLLGYFVTFRLPVDVFPDLTASTVTILADAHGMAPEEVETLVAFPIETAMNGASGVRRVRSSLTTGVAVIWIEFEWGTDVFQARQIVAEKLQSAIGLLPLGMDPPMLAPVSSLMGEIMLVGVSSDSLPAMDLRSFADNILRRRLLAVPGVSQVVAIGGERKQYQVLASPERLAAYQISLDKLQEAVSKANLNSTGGFFVASGSEYLIRGVGRVEALEDLKRAVVTVRDGSPILVEHVADVQIGAATKLGTSSVSGCDAVILSIQKQPNANTLELTERLDAMVADMKPLLPADVDINNHVFRQADFIDVSIHNVVEALRDGAILVTIILLLFLANIRTTFISLISIPLSLILAMLAMYGMGLTINTMTLGGMAIAVGVLVDDAIIYVENVYRRLRENRTLPVDKQRPSLPVIFEASNEIRQPMVIATFIIIAVFAPLFFMSGIEGRLLLPLGFAFVIAVFASLLVAVTIVPALSLYLLPTLKQKAGHQETWVVRKLKTGYRPALEWALKRGNWVIASSLALIVVALMVYAQLGRSFLPEFNEGSATIIALTPPGTSLQESTDMGELVERRLMTHPAVLSVARRTGRGELDEHSFGSNQTELEVRLKPEGFHKEQVFRELRELLTDVPGTVISVGQPLSHRIDHMLSGTQAALAVKIFGSNLYELRNIAQQVKAQMQTVDGLVDLAVEAQVDVPQLRVEMDRDAMAVYGVQVADLAENIETAFNGEVVGQVLEGQIPFDLVVRFPEAARQDDELIRTSLFATPAGPQVPLNEMAKVYRASGPNSISRENVSRKIVVQANIAGRDLGSAVEEVRAKVNAGVKLPEGYFVSYGGQFESAEAASRIILLLSLLSIGAILVLLYMEFGTFRDAFLVMVNLPLALIGGVFAIYFTSGIVSVAALVGFVTLFGIAARNGILMIAHFHDLIDKEGMSARSAIIRGSMERMNPILMTALCAGLALLPLAMGGGQPGKEIQTPMAVVILGGLLTSTALNMVVLPALYWKFGAKRKAQAARIADEQET